jgi:hypothetical protein
MRKASTLILFPNLELVHHFIDGTDIGSITTAAISGSGYFATDGQSVFYYCRKFAVFMLRDALPDERTGL